ncbi:M13 family metallopeptidase [uncultured Mucilaginibacter sp.]|uniref:M13 family metallopeptidase n=1 Tax=uncultured Mucilaginibacter sp. TaxID=797541 RepID=UPI0025E5AF71|nr:M13 family metallopeptidase [uncultured Mucilaginibacter sp.]
MKYNFGNWMLAAAALCLSANVQAGDGGKNKKAKADPPKKFIDPANMDKSVKPGDNFFEYANGGWLKANEIPAKETRWGSFNILNDDNKKKLQGIVTEVSAKTNAPKGSIEQRVGDLYASGMDTMAIEKRGYTPIQADLQRIDAIQNLDGVINEIVFERVNALGSPLFSFGVRQDSKNPTKYIVGFGQGGTSLPDRDYYLKSDARTKRIQDAYKQYIVDLFTLTGSNAETAAKNAATIWGIESKLAEAQMTRVAMRDPNKTYNKFATPALAKTTPHLNWVEILPKLKVGAPDSVLVSSPSFLTTADGLLASVPVEDWKTYLKWGILRGSAGSLSSPFVKSQFKFSSVLSGQQVQAPRYERMTGLVDGSLGELLGQLYVAKYFTPAAKAYMVGLVNNLKVTLGERIQRLDWMTADTKARAMKKLNAFTVKIGYTDKWETYNGLNIDRNDYFGNLRRINVWSYNDMVGRLGKPVDKTEWGMTPPTVNAYYSPVNNEIVFPAGILQFPFFDFKADDAINYGGIGAVIGHEMTHGFDDQGRQYDADGTLRDWWKKEDADKFKSRADLVVNQYNAFTVLDTVHVNGKLTLGENLADLGGLSVAYDAFKKTKQGKSNTKIDGFTPDQRFFLSWAQVWRGKKRPEASMQQIMTDPHSPEQFRTNAPITNMDAWYKAFNIQPGNKMYKKPEERIKIW